MTRFTNRGNRSGALAVLVAASLLAFTGCDGTAHTPIPATSPPPLSFDAGSVPDWAGEMVKCLGSKGWDVTVGVDNSVRARDVPHEQRPAYVRDQEECLAEYGYDDEVPEFSDAQLQEVLPHRLWEWKCLDEEGYEPDPPPSEQTFIDAYHAGKGTWTPYSQFTATLPEGELKVLFEVCPRA